MDELPSKKAIESIDGLLKEYVDNPYLIIPDPGTGLRLQFEAVASLNRARRAKRRCLWPNCTAAAIDRSHTIPRAAALSQIASDGHLITPVFSQKSGLIEGRRIGINEASAIPGFCLAHEAEFAEFEVSGHIDTTSGLVRQLFRSICREIVWMEVYVAHQEQQLVEYQAFCHQQIESLVRDRTGDATASVTSVSPNSLYKGVEERCAGTKRTLEFFRSTLYPQAALGLTDPEECGLEVVALHLDTVIPVCLSGTGSFQVRRGDSTHHVQAVIVVVPGKTNTLVGIATAAEDREHLATYEKLMMGGGFQLLSVIESWMVHGTDHWFLSPRVWNEVAERHRRKILDDIEDPARGIATPYGLTIFNHLKRDWIALLDTNSNVSAADRQRILAAIPPFTDDKAIGMPLGDAGM